MGKWHTDYATECGHEVPVHEDWDGPPRFCKECKAENDAKWYDVSCQECGATIRAHRDWNRPPRFCPGCKAERDSKWYDKRCENCGTTFRACRDWQRPPRFCPDCKAREDANWYDKHCESCGTTIRARRDWNHPPRFCPLCKERNDAQWTERNCRKCGRAFRVKKEWSRPPEFCKDCKSGYKPIYKSCAHCGESFEIPVGTQLKCAEKDWELPRRCKRCRELFRHKPFKTVREKGLTGDIVYRTYNSRGDFISESRKEKGVYGDEVKHRSRFGKHTGTTYVKGGVFGESVTQRPDGSTKSTSHEFETLTGEKSRRSRGGSSQTGHETHREEDWTGGKANKTE